MHSDMWLRWRCLCGPPRRRHHEIVQHLLKRVGVTTKEPSNRMIKVIKFPLNAGEKKGQIQKIMCKGWHVAMWSEERRIGKNHMAAILEDNWGDYRTPPPPLPPSALPNPRDGDGAMSVAAETKERESISRWGTRSGRRISGTLSVGYRHLRLCGRQGSRGEMWEGVTQEARWGMHILLLTAAASVLLYSQSVHPFSSLSILFLINSW